MVTAKPRRSKSIEILEQRLMFVSPVNHVPGAQTCIEDTSLLFSSATNTQISFTDVDGPGPYEVELNAVNGTSSIPANATVSITGNGTDSIRIIGTLTNVNTAMASITFKPTNGFEGLAGLAIETDDQNGAGGLTDTDLVNIDVTPNQRPNNSVPGTQTTGMNSFLRFSAPSGNHFSFNDVDGPGPFRIELHSTNGVLQLVNFSGTTVTGNATNNITIVGSLGNVNAAISDFFYFPTTGFTGDALVTIESNDFNGNSDRYDTDAVTVRVVNGTPPAITSSAFRFETNHAIEFKFNHAIDETTLGNSDILIRSLPTNQGVPITIESRVYTPATFTVRYNLSSTLADGNYEYVLKNDAVADLNSLTNGFYAQPFYVLAGDANRDRVVNFNDLLIVSQNYGLANRTFSQGNFDYSANGLVDFGDLLIIAQQYEITLPAARTGNRFGLTRIGDDVLSTARSSRVIV
ncbi:MAG TPA: Ig-like domain-containing protein [Tepidisphaeraceae bacterium]|nr:Ig-like domain-containing protein [Tepidisphaeraceae bacterium]